MTKILTQAKGKLIDAIASSKDMAVDVAEVGFDTVLDDGVLKDLPLVNWIAKANSIHQTYVLKKLYRNAQAFLAAIESGDPDTVEKVSQKLDQDSKFAARFGEVCAAVMIESLMPLKAEILGRLVVALGSGALSKEQYDRVSLVVHSAPHLSLELFPEFWKRSDNRAGYTTHSNLDGMEGYIMATGVASRHGNMLRMSEDGKALWQFGYKGSLNTTVKST